MHHDLLAGVDDLEEAEVGLQLLIERFILLLVVLYPRLEVFDDLCWVL